MTFSKFICYKSLTVIPQRTDITGTRGCAKSAMEGWFTQFSHEEEFEVKPHHLLTTFPVLPDEWKLSLKLKPKKTMSWRFWSSNVIILTTDLLTKKRGFLPPRVFLSKSGGIKIISGVNKPMFGRMFLPKNYKTLQKREEWVKIEISQELRLGRLWYRVMIDGVEKFSVENKTPHFFENVKLYTGYKASMLDPFKGWIKELSIQIKEDNVIKHRQMTKIKNHYSKDPPSGDIYVLGVSFKKTSWERCKVIVLSTLASKM